MARGLVTCAAENQFGDYPAQRAGDKLGWNGLGADPGPHDPSPSNRARARARVQRRATDGDGGDERRDCIFSAIEQGDPQGAEQLLPLVYAELRCLAAQKLAREAPGQTFQATALVHEADPGVIDADHTRRSRRGA
jgi:hypothetical protein